MLFQNVRNTYEQWMCAYMCLHVYCPSGRDYALNPKFLKVNHMFKHLHLIQKLSYGPKSCLWSPSMMCIISPPWKYLQAVNACLLVIIPSGRDYAWNPKFLKVNHAFKPHTRHSENVIWCNNLFVTFFYDVHNLFPMKVLAVTRRLAGSIQRANI